MTCSTTCPLLPPPPPQGRQWSLAIDVFNHMVNGGIECDAVTCCSLITALDKGGQWQLAEQVCVCWGGRGVG